MTSAICLLTGCVVAAAASTTDGPERLQADSGQPVMLPGVRVVAERIPMSVEEIPAAVYVRDVTPTDRSTFHSVGHLAGSVPGLRSYPVGNLWGQCIVDVRGFYGGGQAQYLLVTLDGIPLNNISSGLVNWSDLDLAGMGRMESVKGPVSSQYGDFGFGGMLALYSQRTLQPQPNRVTLQAGADEALAVTAQTAFSVGRQQVFITGSRRQNDGWRPHSRFELDNILTRVNGQLSSKARLNGLLGFSHSDEQFPGALTEKQLFSDRSQVGTDVFGNRLQDRAERRQYLAGLSADLDLAPALQLLPKVYINAGDEDGVVTTTVPLRHDPRVVAMGTELALRMEHHLGHRPLTLAAGVSSEYGYLATRYGMDDGYGQLETITEGDGRRIVVSGFVSGLYQVLRPLSISCGLRMDNVDTRFNYDHYPAMPDGRDTSFEASQDAFRMSPKIGLSFTPGRRVSVYISVAGAFKAPTLVHLYDSPPFIVSDLAGNPSTILVANDDLDPMRGGTFEAGVRVSDLSGISSSVNLFHYLIRNEIDFDDSTFRYVSLGKSRHSGVELTASRAVLAHLHTEASVTYSAAEFRSGEFDGNQINGVPTWTYAVELSYDRADLGYVRLRVDGAARRYLDQANSRRLGDYATALVAAGLSWSIVDVSLRIDNIFDRDFEYDGFFDPLARSFKFYPAPGRQVTVTVAAGL